MIFLFVLIAVFVIGALAEWYFKRDNFRRHCKNYMKQEINNWKK